MLLFRQYLPLVILFFLSSDVFSQNGDATVDFSPSHYSGNICSNDMILDKLRKDPAYVALEEQMNRSIAFAARNQSDTIITLPVVVHIMDTDPDAISDAFVLNGINDLNNAFAGSGVYAGGNGADTRIMFCLAKTDEYGGITTGITRTNSIFSNDLNMDNEDEKLKDLVKWDPSKYINIWLVRNIRGESYADFHCGTWYRIGVSGYAGMPPADAGIDGIVTTGFGKILAHQMGHYLGLYHTFENGCRNMDCTSDGDRVCDTPPDNSVRPSSSCTDPDNTCGTEILSNFSNGSFPLNVPDQISNFMDYGNTDCSNKFTAGQAARMRAVIDLYRPGLLENKCVRPCSQNIIAKFNKDVVHPVPGQGVNFINTSTGATFFEWILNGSIISTSRNLFYTFPAQSEYELKLRSYNSPGCFSTVTEKVIVNCGTIARFYSDKKTIASLEGIYTDSIVFTNTSYNATSSKWLITNDRGMSEQVFTNSTDLTYVFRNPGNYYIRLIASNGTCSDTTEIFTVPVLDPTPDGGIFNLSKQCYDQNKVRVRFCISNYGFASIPENTRVNFYDKDPTLPGATKLSPSFNMPDTLPGGDCYTCYTHILDVDYSRLDRIYAVFNDNGTSLPVTLPNTTFNELQYANNFSASASNKRTVNITLCQGESYEGYTLPGVYIDTFPSVRNGCDSVRTLHLSVSPVYNFVRNISICEGEDFEGHDSTGTYISGFTSSLGCDSTHTLNLVVKPKVLNNISAVICEGENFEGYTATGIYTDIFSASNGCDSTRVLDLRVNPAANSVLNIEICSGGSYQGYSVTGTYIDTLVSVTGCDSIRTLHLLIKENISVTINAEICAGESYAAYTIEGTYTDTYSSSNGCDSTRILNLRVITVIRDTITVSICEGLTYERYSTSGIYADTLVSSSGCDSIRILDLTVNPVVRSTLNVRICEGEIYGGHSTSGTYTDRFISSNGCDSIRIMNLTVLPASVNTKNIRFCSGGKYFAQGQWQTLSGTYYDTAVSSTGCDSIIKTNIIVDPLPDPDLGEDRYLCKGESYTLSPGVFTSYLWENGSSHPTCAASNTGIYSVTVTNSFGCSASDTFIISRIFNPIRDFLPKDTSLCNGNPLKIHIPGFLQYQWSSGSTSGSIDINRSGEYILLVKDGNGCSSKDTVNVIFTDCITIQIPGAFTPNNDGLNDVFRPVIPVTVSNYKMQIFDRGGQLLFSSNDHRNGWDGNYKGSKQSSGGYVYIITLNDNKGEFIKRAGSLLLLR